VCTWVVGKILEFSCRQPALCTGAQHQSRWVHILQPLVSRGLSARSFPETARRRDAPLRPISAVSFVYCVAYNARRGEGGIRAESAKGLQFRTAAIFLPDTLSPVRAIASGYSVHLWISATAPCLLAPATRGLLINSRASASLVCSSSPRSFFVPLSHF
jgi:hypothetical protein